MNSVQDIYKIGKQMEKIHKKASLLYKKKESFGLTAEEEEKLHECRKQSWILHEELIETHMNISVMPFVTNKEYYESLEEIQKIIPWDGGIVRRNEDLEEITERAVLLSDDEREFLAKKLEFIHTIVMQQFELFCSSEEGYKHIQDASKVISMDEDGNILDVLVYLDARYRELAEYLDVELQEVDVLWEDEE